MPLAVESLTKDSSPEQTRESISQSIATCMEEGGKSQEECAAMAYSIAREKTGKELNEGRNR
jgi:hypothetical protein